MFWSLRPVHTAAGAMNLHFASHVHNKQACCDDHSRFYHTHHVHRAMHLGVGCRGAAGHPRAKAVQRHGGGGSTRGAQQLGEDVDGHRGPVAVEHQGGAEHTRRVQRRP